MARVRKTTGNYKGGRREVFAPDLNQAQPYETITRMFENNEEDAWKEYSRIRSIARKRHERAVVSPITRNESIVRRREALGGFPSVASLKALSNPKAALQLAYSDAMAYLSARTASPKRERAFRVKFIKNLNKSIKDAGGKGEFKLEDYESYVEFLAYARYRLQKKYGKNRWLDYYDSGDPSLIAYSMGREYGLDNKDIYQVYEQYLREKRRTEQRQARQHVKNPRKKVKMTTTSDWLDFAKKAGVLDDFPGD